MFDSRNAAIIDICRSYELVEESVLKNLLASSENSIGPLPACKRSLLLVIGN